MIQPSTVTGLVWSLLRRAWRRLTGESWYVECARCYLQLGAPAAGLPGDDFTTRAEADLAARDAGWLVEDDRDLCPAHAREEAPA